MSAFSTWIEVLRTRARESPAARAFTFLDDDGGGEMHLSYAALDERARAIGALLQARGVRGERALLLYPPGLEYIAAFFGCLYAGAVAVPAYPPRLNRSLPRLRSILEDARPRVALTTAAILARVEGWREQAPDLKEVPWIATGELPNDAAGGWAEPDAEPGTLAFLQYTSGSTGTPKGVMLSHGNLLHNSRAIHRCFGYTAETRGMVWLPPYHDMGLIGGILQPLHGGFPVILMSPVSFLQNPLRWLAAISRGRVTMSGAPDFAYDLCVRRIPPAERAGLDLSCWELAFTGAEPVRPATLERFAEAFAPCGFRREAFYPCYGLAEATLIVSGGMSGAGPVEGCFEAGALERRAVVPQAGGKRLAGNGPGLPDQRLVIVDPETALPCPPGRVGEIWVAGPSVAAGYWNRPEETLATFGAQLAGEGETPFLRTGDLGFLVDGELFVAGRQKDLIILRGRNHYPQDLEATAEASHPAVRPGAVAAFSADAAGEERLVVVAEVERTARLDTERVAQAVRQAIAEEHEAQVGEVVLIRTATLPKTSSGKIQRRACREAWLAGDLVVVGRSAVGAREAGEAPDAPEAPELTRAGLAALPTERRRAALLAALRAEAARVLRIPAVRLDPERPLAGYGLDSLAAAELKAWLNASLGVAPSFADLLEGASLSDLTGEILARLADPQAAGTARGTADGSRPSHGQRALWFMERLAPASGANHIVAAARLGSVVDTGALARAFAALAARHPALRTTLAGESGEPVARIEESPALELLEEDVAPDALDERLADAAYRPFDLQRGPLVRMALFSRGGERVLLFVVHHIAADFWSLTVLARELGLLYAAETGGPPAGLSPPASTYGDFVAWQDEILSGPRGERLWSYWLEQLGGELPLLDLPTDRPRPPVQSFRGGARAVRLPADLALRLGRLARERGATLYVLLLAAFQTLLHRSTRQRDLLIGSPTAGRGAPGSAGVVGYFVNPVALRAEVDAAHSFDELLARTRRTVLEALEHQELPLALLAERLQPVRDTSRPVLFGAVFVLQKAQRPEDQALAGFALGGLAGPTPGIGLDLGGGLAVEPWPFEPRRTQFDLTLAAAEVDGGLAASLQFAADLFDPATVERMLGHWVNLLTGIAAGSGRPIGLLPWLSGAERRQLVLWNDTAAELPDVPVHRQFAGQAARTPAALAVSAGGGRATYRELHERSGRLARRLRGLGAGPESVVGVCLEESVERTAGILAVLLAGGAYLPLDPTHPPERLADLLDDAGARVVLTQERLRGRLPDGRPGLVTLALDAPGAFDGEDGEPVSGAWTGPGSLAYVIYTSGSTGRPKGVGLTHRGLANLVAWHRRVYEVTERDRATRLAGPAFDASVWELWPYLTAGASVHAPEETVRSSPAELLRWMAAEGITLAFLPTPLAEACLREEPPPGLELRALLTGGDRLASRPPRDLPFLLVNHYGPTEGTVVATSGTVGSTGGVPSIGRPIANTRVHLLDPQLVRVPAGVPGEAYLAGAGLARGYLGRPELTAEAFLPDPFGKVPGSRLYRTGDLARYRPDGALEFLGRLDGQVKVRGVRIELGEVEAALAGLSTVREAAVLVRDDAAGRRLVGYVVPEGPPGRAADLRPALAARLPDALVPSAFVFLEALPLTPNGKVDRRALAAIAPEAATGARAEPPRTPVEELVAGIWGEILDRDRIGTGEDFFELGGHSLSATRVMARLRDATGVELPLTLLFEHRTVAGLAEQVEAALRAPTAAAAGPAAPIVLLPRDGGLPLSFAQERLWLLDQIEPGSPAYNIPAALRLEGRLDAAAFQRSLSEIARRHEVLRTVFAAPAGAPVQRIAAPAPLPLPVVDLAGLAGPARGEEAERIARSEARRPFDLARGPLLRLTLLRLAREEHQALLVLHHIAADGWSMGVLLGELAALYRAFAAGESSPLSDLPVQYADFAAWQRGWLSGDVLARQLAAWRRRLDGAPQVLALPADRPRPAAQRQRGARWPLEIPGGLAGALAEGSRRLAATPFMILLAAFQTLLGRHGGQEDLLVGAPVANRRRTETEALIGFFVNTLPLRGDLSGDPPFREMVARTRAVSLDAWAHQDLPFERLVEEVAPERDLSRPPLVQVLLAYQSGPGAAAGGPDLPGLRTAVRPVDNGTAKLDLTLTVSLETGEPLAGVLEYDSDLFDRTTAARLARSFATLLAGALAGPGRRLPELPLLAEIERQQLLIEWAAAESGPAAERCLHEMIEEQAARTPDAVALVTADESLTYRELLGRAGRVARHLRARGVGPETRVAVCLPRTAEMVAALLGVLAAGGAYVPIDPAYPEERRRFMLEDSGAIVLIEEALIEEAGLRPVAAGLPAGNGHAALPGNLAYLIYTSGSTGRPKGVAITHRSAAVFVDWVRSVFPPDDLRGVLAATSICFDLSVFELFAPLAAGGTVILGENALALSSHPAASMVTLVNTVPSAIAELVRNGGLPASVRTVNLAGEPLRRELADRVYAQPGVERVLNLYGPSEDTTYSTFSIVGRGNRAPAIGRPVGGTRAHVLAPGVWSSPQLPPGVSGELFLGGDGLARGYLGRPDLTAERFVPDPWGREPGARLYRTGDLARRRPDGEIEFLGRRDHQVKVRGFRIELGEVESALSARREVREAAVLAVGEPGEQRLVAYVVTADGPAPTGLRGALAARLPAYMVPSVFVVLDALPRTPNGKVDRQALARLDAGPLAEPVSAAAPRNPTEELLAGIWAEVLKLERVGTAASFFDLGGHSLLAARVVARVREAFGVDLPLRALFEAPTVAALAARIAREQRADLDVLPLRPVERGGEIPLSFAQERLWFLDRLDPGSPVYGMPFALCLAGPLQRPALHAALETIVHRHESLRTTFELHPESGRPVQRIAPLEALHLTVIDLAALPDGARLAEAERLAADEARRPFDLARGPLVRFHLVALPEEHRLLADFHHTVSDGWSIEVFLRELAALYRLFATGEGIPPAALPVQYADWAVWQRAWLEMPGVLEPQLAWWRERLAGAPAGLDLPLDRRRPALQTFHGAQATLELPADLATELRALSRRRGVTLFMTLLAGFHALLGRLSGQDDVLAGSPVAHRNRIETEGLIGFFVNLLALRGDLSGEPGFHDLLEREREASLGAYAHQDLPFERLVEELRPQRDLSRSPLFQVMLAHQGALPALDLPGLAARTLPLANGTSRLELTLGVAEPASGLTATLEYNTDLFDAATAVRLLERFARLLAGAAAEPARAVADLPLLSEAESAQLLVTWNAATPLPDEPACLHQLFEAQAARTPDAPALVHGLAGQAFGERTLTYAELDRRADRLAARLRALGVGPEERVGILLPRTPEMVIGLLGILKAGGAYVPVDPAYPEERRRFMLEDSGAAVFLGVEGIVAAGESPATGSGGAVQPGHLAYVIYTSGSTGRPKAVAIEHASAVALVRWARGVFADAELAAVLASTSICFDLSVFELFVPLAWGGTVVLAENALELPRLAARGEVTLINTVPSAIAELARGGLPASVRTVNLAGEPLERDLVRRVFASSEVRRVLNLYGPSEDTTYSTFAEVPPGAVPTIGRPVAGTRAHVLDRRLRLVPVGVPGELCLGGTGLARGYLRRPELTAERFVPDPFGNPAGSRLYRTGDLARRLPSGELEFLGRIDHQVKVRGFRIELGEIEAALAEHPAVARAVVLARGSEDRSLAAYVAAVVADVPGAELRRFLQSRLPDFMIPSAFVMLDSLPLTPNGKVDRKALALLDPAERGKDGETAGAAPRTPAEELLAGIWAEVLGIDHVPAGADFFDLGGHSLLAARVAARVRSTFGVELPLRSLFEAPTVAGLAGLIAAAHRPAGAPEVPITPVPRTAEIPLSWAQERLWFLDRLAPGGSAYNVPVAVRLTGELDPGRLAGALAGVARRHEVLRTRFGEAGGRPVQVIDPEPCLPVRSVDLSGLPAEERETEARRLLEAEARQPFDLARGPLGRALLARLAGGEHVALINLHHIVTDGWSTGVLLREVAALYGGMPLPALPVQYADYAVWQRAWLQGPVLEAQIGWWRERLDGAPPELPLPADRPRPARPTLRGGRVPVSLDADVWRKIQTLARARGATPFIVLLAAFQALLARLSGEEDVLVGSPVANRRLTETEGLIGFFINMLVMRTPLAGDPPFHRIVERARETALGAWAHQDVPFERLVEELQPERNLARPPFFQAVLVLQNTPMPALELPGLTLEPVEADTGTAKFDLMLSLTQRGKPGEGAAGWLEHSADRFDPPAAQRIAAAFEQLTAAAMADPRQRLSELPLLSEEERWQILFEWNDTATPYPREALVHELFEEQAERSPDRVALLFGDESVTYGDLDVRANQLAHHLHALGVGPEVRVGLCLDRSPGLVAAILGILKAGGVYVPLDPSYPRERLELMLEDTDVAVLLTERQLLPSRAARHAVLVDAEREAIARRPAARPLFRSLGPDGLAYVMYTSGSTGRPKGVAVSHRAIVRLVRDTDYARFADDEVFLQLAPISFDASTLEIWGALANGARLAVFPPGMPSLEEVGREIERLGVTSVWLTAGFFHLMVDGRLASLRGLRQLLAGGDVLSLPHVRRVLAELPGCRMINGYGPTESTTFTCCHTVTEESLGSSVPLGRPIANTMVYVLDRALRPVPPGLAGELYTGGDGLARGYLNRPELTAERFVPDPWSGRPGGRLYRTGDLVRLRPDGLLEIIGRTDSQVKLRGFRVEPAEIEVVLCGHPAVAAACVLVREPAGDKRLVAFAAVEDGPARPTSSGLRTFLQERLPDYMVPSAFVLVDELPLNANGKVDRKALALLDPAEHGKGGETAGAAPRTPAEELLAGIWSELLGAGRVGIDDDFFALGGHSLTAARLVARVYEVLGVELPVRAVFEAPTVAALARKIAAGTRREAPPIPRRPPEEPARASFSQERLWFLDRFAPGDTAYNIPVAVRLRGRLDAALFESALNAVADRQEALRTGFRESGGQVLQEIAPRPDLRAGLADLSALPEEARGAEARRLTREEAVRPFDLARPPLARATLLRLDASEHVALVTLHHIVADGWSIGVLLGEIAAFYGAFAEGREPPLPKLPALPVQYADYAAWQRGQLQGEELASHTAWWRERLAGAPAVLALPTDRPRPAVASSRGASLPVTCAGDCTRDLAALGRRHGATLFMMLLAAFQILLARLCGQERLVVGSPVANRTRIETEGLIGFFLNTLPLAGDLGGDPSFLELLGRVRETALGAYAHQELPFEKLVTDLAPERSLSHAPVFQVLLVLQNTPLPAFELPGLALEPVVVESDSAKLDLVLNLIETGEGLAGRWIYKTDLFDRATVLRFTGHLRTLLAGIAAAPGERISELPLLSPAEAQQLRDWNATGAGYPEACLHELIEAQVRRTPGAIAVSAAGEELSYEDLDRAASTLARRLIELGAGPEVRVGIAAERSLELVVGLLAILQAGGAWVPLDPSYPRERLAWLLEDSRIGVLLTQERLLEALPAHGARIVLLDGAARPDAGAPEPRPAGGAGPDNLAYVIYTSGSTGRPKGAMNTHRGIVNRLLWMQERYGLGAADRVLQKTPASFDVSVWELFWPLLTGARLVMARPGAHGDSAYLAETIAAEGITTLHFVPSMLQVFTGAPDAGRCRTLARVLASGEALSLDLQDRFLARVGAPLHNLYGPTEAAVDVTHWTCEPGGARLTVPIGRPVANTAIHLLDRALHPVPVGVAGELFIGGVQVGRGYWERPDLTAERFVPDPLATEPGARLYRTGDLARFAPDGAIEYLGRLDHQVKIRGFRIELGEIEAALAGLPDVREAVVLALAPAAGGAAGDLRLVACVTPADLDTVELREALLARLPEHMVPSAFVRLASLPLLPNGKADRQALARLRPEAEAGAAGTAYVAPRTELERYLAGLWSEAVGAGRVGIHDSFFDLGGSSISGAILINRLQEKLGEIVHVVAIFDHPTVAGFAAWLAREREDAAGEARRRIGEEEVAELRRIVTPVTWRPARPRNPPAVFVLSPPRSGSTLLRVMLAGHPRLFAPPELELLTFGDMAGRRAAFSGRESFWLDGLIRAVMEVRRCGAGEATEILAACEAEALPTQELYRRLQGWLGDRRLVDKTPSYALDPALLARIEETFEEPCYLHLTRHPYGMIRSFEEAKLEQVFFRYPHPFSRRELAELVWTVSHENIERFLAGVPAARRHRVRFEDLVRDPEGELRAVCATLGIDYHPDMADPYKDRQARMTDGVHAASRMLGDVKFLGHGRVDAEAAERWREEPADGSLGEPARSLAAALGYDVEPPRSAASGEAWVPIARLPREPGEALPVSFSQERLWFLDRLDPGSAAYNIPAGFRLEGRLSVPALAASAAEIARRHEALRTTFAERDGRPVQLVAPPRPVPLPLIDLTGLPEVERRAEAARLARREAARPFDLAAGPLVRLALLRLAGEEWVAFLTLHHIVADGWSLGIFVRELMSLYTALSAGEPPALPELPVQYADYAAWQRARLTGPALDALLGWWRERLLGTDGAPPILELPVDRPRPPVQSLRGGERSFALPPELSQGLRALSRREGATLFMTMLAAFQALLGRLAGQPRVLVGTPVANRNRAETEGLIGFFANTLVLSGDLAGEDAGGPEFRELLARTRQESLGAFAHAEVPFERLVEALRPQRDLSRPPLFQVMLAYQNTPLGALALPGLALSPLPAAGGTAKFELTLAVAEAGEDAAWRLAGSLEYSADLFDPATVERLLGQLEILLSGAVADPGRRLEDLPLLSAAERQQVALEWPAGGELADGGACLYELFTAQARQTPDALALVAGTERLTYGALAARVQSLAARLRALGAGPERPIGVCLERSADLVVALLAVLEAGSAYVPLDPAYPRERLDFMLSDAGAGVLITRRDLADRCEPFPGITVQLDQTDPTDPSDRSDLPPIALPDDLAYVIYTSGSTGRPKGVAITHRSAVAFVRWAGAVFPPEDLRGVFAATSICFDLSVFELFVPLAWGGTVILGENALALAGHPAASMVTLVNTVPSAAAELVRLGAFPTSVRTVNLAGEPLLRSLADRIYAQPGVERLFNLYGPSEDTTYSTWALVPRDSRRAPAIGRPLAGSRAYVLDERLEPAPAGELYLGGRGLARGYLGRPELTAERFVPDPFGAPGGRLYRTGDLARWRADGELEFLGRRDLQVKVRGFRIELGEIEALLARHPGVRDAVAVAREDGGETRLVAYVVPGAEPAPAARELRDFLRRELPEHMVPTAFVPLAALPLTPNGKVDRRALPSPETAGVERQAYVAPRTLTEELLAGIWAEVLRIERVGVHDNFFDLGGHSLLATQVVSRIRQETDLELPLRTLFQHPTLEGCAGAVEDHLLAEDGLEERSA